MLIRSFHESSLLVLLCALSACKADPSGAPGASPDGRGADGPAMSGASEPLLGPRVEAAEGPVATAPVASPDFRRVPVAGSPVLGKPTALVTLVLFSEIDMPTCAQAEPVVATLQKEYGDDLRVVWKSRPLAYHPRSEAAAELMIEARRQKGDAGFWHLRDLLFAQKERLDDNDLEAVAKSAGLDVTAAMKAVHGHAHAAAILEDQDLADELAASSTPHFFINGRRLPGLQPIDRIRALIDEQRASARALVAGGVAPERVYEAILEAAAPSPGFDKPKVSPPTKDNPTRGPRDAKVVVEIFSDFQCPLCKAVEPTLDQLDHAFPGKVRFVWRNFALPMHDHAEAAAEASLEVFQQKGPDAFWKMHDVLFREQERSGGGSFDRPALARYADELGADVPRFDAALDAGAHRAVIDADRAAAGAAGFSGSPGFLINGYRLIGAAPLSDFERLVRRALREAR